MTNNGQLEHINDALSNLSSRNPSNKRQISDRHVSIEALEKFLILKIPKVLNDENIEFLSSKIYKNDIDINGISIIVAPEIIFKITIDGTEVLGGLKLHVSKSNSFDKEQQQVIASGICHYLENNVAQDKQIVLPEFCISLDIFGNGFITNSTAKKKHH